MAENFANVLVAGTGVVYLDTAGTASAPTGTADAMAGYTDLGTIGEEAITETIPAGGDSTVIKNFAGQPVRTITTPSDDPATFSFTLLEENVNVAKVAYNDAVAQTATEGSVIFKAGQTRAKQKWALKVIDGAEIRLIYIPQGEVTEIGDKEYLSTNATRTAVTITAHYDSGLDGNVQITDTRWKS